LRGTAARGCMADACLTAVGRLPPSLQHRIDALLGVVSDRSEAEVPEAQCPPDAGTPHGVVAHRHTL